MAYCRTCGAQVEAAEQFCSRCGASLGGGETGHQPTSQPTPQATVPTIPPPAPPPRKRKDAAIIGIVAIVVILIAAILIVSLPRPQAPAGGDGGSAESPYLSDVGNVLQDAAPVLTRFSGTLDDYVDGRISDVTAMQELEGQHSEMVTHRNRMRAMQTPCSAYDSMHTSLQTALANFADSIEKTIDWFETGNPDDLDAALIYLEYGKDDLNRARAELDQLRTTIPNC